MVSNKTSELCSEIMKLTHRRSEVVLSKVDTFQKAPIKIFPRKFVVQDEYTQFLSENDLGSMVV
jgi:hypothetical protein